MYIIRIYIYTRESLKKKVGNSETTKAICRKNCCRTVTFADRESVSVEMIVTVSVLSVVSVIRVPSVTPYRTVAVREC